MVLSLYLVIFILGLCVGSFLNCLIYRLKEKQTFLAGRSFCPKCGNKLGFFDLIPILSFIILRGKCRYCHQKISIQYPLVEIATGALFLLIFNFQFSIFNEFSIFNFQYLINLVYLLIISCLLVIIFVYDLKHFIIPDKVIYPAIAIVFLYKIIFSIEPGSRAIGNFQKSDFYPLILSALGASGFFFLLWLGSRGKWMGFGDVKLGFLMGLFLGWPSILVALFSAFFIGAIIGTGLIILGKKTLKSEVPFGPFLVIGTFIALFWGPKVIDYLWRAF